MKVETFCCFQINGMKFPTPPRVFSTLVLVRKTDAQVGDQGPQAHSPLMPHLFTTTFATVLPVSIKYSVEKAYKNCNDIY